jgi:FdhE protein
VTQDIDSKILEKLAAMEKEEGGLPLLLQFYRGILHVQVEARKGIETPQVGLSDDVISERTQQGIPLLSFDEIKVESAPVQDLFVRVAGTYANYPGVFGEITDKLRSPEAGRRLTPEAIRAWYNGEALPPAILSGADDTMVRAIIQFTLKPLLSTYAAALISSVKQDRWRRGYCPICGGIPDIAFLEKGRGARYLVCSRCDSAWLFQRLECPYCGTQDQNALAYFTDEKGLYQLNVCDKCKRYLKTIDLRKTDKEVLIPLERLLTAVIDRQAQERGYQPPK